MLKQTFIIFILSCSGAGSFAKTIDREPQQVGGDVGMKQINVTDLKLENATLETQISFKGSETGVFTTLCR